MAPKARLAKQGLTIPRLELVACHMATNLANNVKEALEGYPVDQVYCWSDSTVALHWIGGEGDYKQFVHNRVRKIQDKNWITIQQSTQRSSWKKRMNLLYTEERS